MHVNETQPPAGGEVSVDISAEQRGRCQHTDSKNDESSQFFVVFFFDKMTFQVFRIDGVNCRFYLKKCQR